MSGRLDGKVALVTGAASGLGLAIASRFGAEGARVVFADLDARAAASAAQSLRDSGGDGVEAAVDVTDLESVERAAALAIERYGALNVLVANAGIAGEGAAATLSQESWNRVIAVNLTGVWHSMRAVLGHMVEHGGGSIVATASVAGLTGVPNIPSYSAAKAGVIGLTRQVAVDYARHGIRVNAICPGTVRTPLVEQAYRERAPEDPEAAIAERAATVPLGRLGTPEDIANLALFLASDEAAWITGAIHAIDGGTTAAMVPSAT